MRKLLLSVFGLLLLSTAFLFTSDAEELACKASFQGSSSSSRGVYRPFSNRRGYWSYSNAHRRNAYGRKQNTLSPCESVRKNPGGLYSRYRKARVRNPRIAREINRLANPQFYPRAENVRASGLGKVVVRNNDISQAYNQKPHLDRTIKFSQKGTTFRSVLSPDEVVLNLPDAFKKVDDLTYESRRGPLKVRVVRTPARYTCRGYQFARCIRDLKSDFLSEQDLSFVFQQGREAKLSRTLLGDRMRHPVARETFTAQWMGQEQLYIHFYALDPRDESIVMVQLVTDISDARDASEIADLAFAHFKFQ